LPEKSLRRRVLDGVFWLPAVKVFGQVISWTGLKVRRALDNRNYPEEVKVTDEQIAAIRFKPDSFRRDWN
jgi:hypothetical protein